MATSWDEATLFYGQLGLIGIDLSVEVTQLGSVCMRFHVASRTLKRDPRLKRDHAAFQHQPR